MIIMEDQVIRFFKHYNYILLIIFQMLQYRSNTIVHSSISLRTIHIYPELELAWHWEHKTN